jgi:hypothetical protein
MDHHRRLFSCHHGFLVFLKREELGSLSVSEVHDDGFEE